MTTEPIPLDRMVLATLSAFSCLVSELSRRDAIDLGALVENIQKTAATHRAQGDPNNIAPAMHRISEYLMTTVPEAKF